MKIIEAEVCQEHVHINITYNITVNSDTNEPLTGINISALIPEGTELIEDSISDNGTVEGDKILWRVDVENEKVVSFTVKVTKTSGNIETSAIVNGKTTNTVTNVIDEPPVLKVINPNKYTMEIGTEYNEKGYSAIDAVKENIIANIIITNTEVVMNLSLKNN